MINRLNNFLQFCLSPILLSFKDFLKFRSCSEEQFFRGKCFYINVSYLLSLLKNLDIPAGDDGVFILQGIACNNFSDVFFELPDFCVGQLNINLQFCIPSVLLGFEGFFTPV